MTLKFYPLDNEWASATGSNVYSGGNTSQFDYPPNAMFNMEITPDPSDVNPRMFEIGDTVDISYSVVGINVTLDDAVVIRSDASPDGGGIVVFEGTNNFGQIEHLVWTPDFDLEDWYWDNFSGGQPPGFYVVDTNPGYSHTFVCFSKETPIVTRTGLVPAGALRVGDLVETIDNGAQPVRQILRKTVMGVGQAAPVAFAPGALGNKTTVRLSQQHRVVVSSGLADFYYGKSEVFVPAKALINDRDIRLAPCRSIEYVHLLLDKHEVLNAAGLACESLLLGEVSTDIIADDPAIDRYLGRPMTAARPILTYREAALLNKSASDAIRRTEVACVI